MSSVRHDVTPNPERITESLRDTGYVLNTAIADIVDNSIAAHATRVEIELALDPRGRLRFSVADNGDGMSAAGLVNALKYGSARRDDPASLGKFGLGLKTASTAFARRLELTSRDRASGLASTAIWDLDEVSKHGWTVEQLAEPDPFDSTRLDEVSPNSSGTVVRWKKIDRVLRDYQAPTGTHAVKAVKKLDESLREHLSLVFQRFLDVADTRAPNVALFVNGAAIEAWDPFGHGATELVDRSIRVQTGPDEEATMTLRVVVLPRKAELQAMFGDDGPKRARLGNKMQGIYVYRENRLIHGPDWLGLWVQEPHFTLSRAELSFDHLLDDAFQVDIKKSRIDLDTSLISALSKMLVPPRNEAQNRYRDGTRESAATAAQPSLHATSNAAISGVAPTLRSAQLKSVDKEHGEAVIRNIHGPVSVKFVDNADSGVYLEAVDSLTDGVLYEPAYIGKNPGVRLNKGHPYYEKVYLPNQTAGTTVQAIDSLLWALASAEFNSAQDATKQLFEDIRFDVSKALRRLVEDLPEPEEVAS
ncbi:ATP-binding protein [Diaminobutyricimonas sp. TR449]|uniref:ATP-binding protein n=1 Tax=Diaminobutyricimonas sp. TR449 TaxID=2708076 RepID=UPI001420DFD1|nr:ATP-binding protein [Diaminobutyricimonas sp. TR449]